MIDFYDYNHHIQPHTYIYVYMYMWQIHTHTYIKLDNFILLLSINHRPLSSLPRNPREFRCSRIELIFAFTAWSCWCDWWGWWAAAGWGCSWWWPWPKQHSLQAWKTPKSMPNRLSCTIPSRVSDPDPVFCLDSDPNPVFKILLIRIRCFKLLWIRIRFSNFSGSGSDSGSSLSWEVGNPDHVPAIYQKSKPLRTLKYAYWSVCLNK